MTPISFSVSDKKRATSFFNITLIFLGGFLHFTLQQKKEWIFDWTAIKFTTSSNCVFNCANVICSLGWPWPMASCSAFDQTGCAQLSQSYPMLFFLIFVRAFVDESLGRKSFRFLQVLIKIVIFRTQHIPIFHFIALLLLLLLKEKI